MHSGGWHGWNWQKGTSWLILGSSDILRMRKEIKGTLGCCAQSNHGRPARVVNVSSMMHELAPGINMGDPNFSAAGSYSSLGAYNRSKLAQVVPPVHHGVELMESGAWASVRYPWVLLLEGDGKAAGLTREASQNDLDLQHWACSTASKVALPCPAQECL